MRIYLDLDHTLVNPVTDKRGNVTAIIRRPGVTEFLEKLSRDGDLWLLTAAERGHAERALSVLWPASKHFRGIITIEDMALIEEQNMVIFQEPGLSNAQRMDLWDEIKPIAPPGVMFDDFPAGSSMYLLKAAAIGIGPDRWIQVEHFSSQHKDKGGLKKAYADFRKRFPHLLYMDGERRFA